MSESEADIPDLDEMLRDDSEWPDGEFIPDDVTCANCAHRHTCQLLVGVGQNVSNFVESRQQLETVEPLSDGELPIQPTDLAKICGHYDPEPPTDDAR